jgi:hypothetical protein
MPNGDGQPNNTSRPDRIEAALELIIGEHEAFRAEHKMLLKAQVLLQDSIERLQAATEKGFGEFRAAMNELRLKMDETTDKLNGLIGAVEAMRANFDARLKRLEGR